MSTHFKFKLSNHLLQILKHCHETKTQVQAEIRTLILAFPYPTLTYWKLPPAQFT